MGLICDLGFRVVLKWLKCCRCSIDESDI
ncbi:hypothetical protein Patl1_14695 [Pistacia atlantica]|uniref:Uncharacterized protein n=1 Tax=Pistacia atlantica TaxID=434234 RepID=A0ACC1AVR8_9ROSI|nr:hypothetical protein Patl1_14695 [Pistacia atlantica]